MTSPTLWILYRYVVPLAPTSEASDKAVGQVDWLLFIAHLIGPLQSEADYPPTNSYTPTCKPLVSYSSHLPIPLRLFALPSLKIHLPFNGLYKAQTLSQRWIETRTLNIGLVVNCVTISWESILGADIPTVLWLAVRPGKPSILHKVIPQSLTVCRKYCCCIWPVCVF